MSKHVLLDYQLSKVKALQSNLFKQNDKLIEMLCLQEDVQPLWRAMSTEDIGPNTYQPNADTWSIADIHS